LNAYSYANITILRNLTFTLGGSFDYLKWMNADFSDDDVHRFNPKAGITWNLLPSTTVRASISSAVKRPLIADQTLEPTQVSGFNQFYDDLNGTKAWRYGAAIDHKFAKTLFGGAELSTRELNFQVIDTTITPETIHDFDGNEYVGRTYLFWTPHPWWGLRTEYQYEGFRNQVGQGEPRKINTHRVPLGVNFFHPSGFSAALATTYYSHGGRFLLPSGSEKSGTDHFWTIDAALNYRLPKRYGFITIGASNLLDKKFKYFDVDRDNPRIQPDRTVFFKVTLALP
jgi:outer membrane receptor protein involved in Fe transport